MRLDVMRLERERTRITIMPALGGRIAQIEILDGVSWLPLLYEPSGVPPEERDPLSWGSFVMAPWPNRIANGRFAFEGAEHHLPVKPGHHALHGVAFDRPWAVDRATNDECVMSLILDDRWPWRGEIRQHLDLRFPGGLRQTIEVRAAPGERFPAGCGWHPWFRREIAGNDVRLFVGADRRCELADDMIPTGTLLDVDREHDLRHFERLTHQRLDDCYLLARAPMRMRWGNIELRIAPLTTDTPYAVVYTAEHAVCIEPQTCAIDAFNLDARGVPAGTAIVDEWRPLVATTEWFWSIGPDRWSPVTPPPRPSDR